MADLLLPIGSHFFTPQALDEAVKKASATLSDSPGKSNIMTGAVDSNGVQTVLVLSSADGHFKAHGAFTHDWAGGNTFAAGGSFALVAAGW